MLLGLHHLAGEFDLGLHIAHLNHRLRGAEGDADQAFVEQLAAQLGVPAHAARWNTRARMKRRRLSGQAGLRRLRREFLSGLARQHGCVAIATAHTADDQLETLLLRIARGTGIRGLGGIAPRRGVWIRPLLEAPREWIESDLTARGAVWREDPSNANIAYARNRVRHRVVPELLAASGGSRSRLACRAAETARDARRSDDALRRLAKRVLSRHCRIRGDVIDLDSVEVTTYPYALQHKVLQELWASRSGGSQGLTQRHLHDLCSLMGTRQGGAGIYLPDGWHAERDREMLCFRRHPDSSKPRESVPRTGWASAGVRSSWVSGPEARERIPAKSRQEEYFAADGIEGKLELRCAEADERFTPFGRQRTVRLGTFLKKQRISRELKSRPTVLSDASGILWVVGVRRSARAPVTPGTRKVLWVHAERHD
jgi:tRNA(Ile)-lysidine synthase